MKHFIKITLFVTLVATIFTACSNDDDYNSDRWVGYGTIQGDDHNFTILLDDKSTLYVSTTLIPYYKGKDGQRVIANFTVLGKTTTPDETEGYLVRLNSIYEVLTKGSVKLSEIDEEKIGDAPINIVDQVWLADSKYLNINFDIQVSPHSNTKHFINLVYDDVNVDQDGFVNVTLRHNDYGERGYWAFSRVSFNISELIPADADKLKLKLNWTNYKGESKSEQHTFDLNPNKPATAAKLTTDKIATEVE